MKWPITPSTFTVAVIVAALLVEWSGLNPAVLVAGVIGAFVGGAALEGTGWEINTPRAAMAMTAGAIIVAILARLVGLV